MVSLCQMRDNLHIIRTPKDRSDEKNNFSYTTAINGALVEYYDDPGITIRVLQNIEFLNRL